MTLLGRSLFAIPFLSLLGCHEVTHPMPTEVTQPSLGVVANINIRDLGPGGSFIGGMNNVGQIAGARTPSGAQIWNMEGDVVDLGRISGAPSDGFEGTARDINDFGRAVGIAEGVTNPLVAFLWGRESGMIDLGIAEDLGFGGRPTGALAAGINELGEVVGFFSANSFTNPTVRDFRAYLWTAETGARDLGNLGSPINNGALDVNALSQVVGAASNAAGETRPFVWSEMTGMVELDAPDLGGTSATAEAINDLGQIIGSTLDAAGQFHALRWEVDGTVVELDPGVASAGGINNLGQVVGSSGRRPVLWTQDGEMIDLGTLGGQTGGAVDIDDFGRIVGGSENAQGEGRTTLWRIKLVLSPEAAIDLVRAGLQNLVRLGAVSPPKFTELEMLLDEAASSSEGGESEDAAASLLELIEELGACARSGELRRVEARVLVRAALRAVRAL